MNEAGWAEKILPSVDNIYHGKNKSFFVYYEIYNTTPQESLSVDYQIVDPKNKILFRKHLRILTTRNYFADSFALDGTDLPPDQFTLLLQIRQKERSTTRSKHFFVQWRGIPKYITDLRVAAEQMVYLLGAEELRKWREANDQQLKEYFLTFWQKQDPAPETEENERLEEYFRRVAYANQNFKVLKREGWRTDRGMVYIKYGTPDEVDRQPFSGGYKPYEIWYYNERRFRVVFIDETGFGDYRIAN
jgi:GWxTD domain-containing protein